MSTNLAQPAPAEGPPPHVPSDLPPVSRDLKRVGIVLATAALLCAVAWWAVGAGKISTTDAQVDGHITSVSTRVPGYVVKVDVEDNHPVSEGFTLVEIDPKDYQAALDQAKAAYDAAVAEARSAKVNIALTRDITSSTAESSVAERHASESDLARSKTAYEQSATASLAAIKANLEAKRATRERANADLERYRPLLASGDVSQLQFDAVAAASRVADSDFAAAEQQVAGAEQSVSIARAQAAGAEFQVTRAQALLRQSEAQKQQVPIRIAQYDSAVAAAERARATLEEAQLQLGYTHIQAPIAGQVTQRSVEVGQYVTPGQLLLTLVPLDKIYVTANFKETQLAEVRPGQKAVVYADMYGRTRFEGVVDSVAGATGSRQALLPPQNATGNFVKVVQRIPVKIMIQRTSGNDGDHGAILRPGMNVEATIYVH